MTTDTTLERSLVTQLYTGRPAAPRQAPDGSLALSPFTADDMHQFHIVGEHSDSDVMLVLGLCYGFGTGVPQDFEQSVSWYHRAARLGNIDAMACLSACYRDGIGIRKDTREANRWLRRAKKAGEAAVDQPG